MNARRILAMALPLLILAMLGSAAWYLITYAPKTERGEPPRAVLTVEVEHLKRRDYQVHVSSFGTVRPHTQSALIAQVHGEIIEVNPSFREGGFFSAGEPLLQIDPRDYRIAVTIAAAGLVEAQQQLAEEEAASAQAVEDWQRLGNPGMAPDLVLRKPQLASAEARVASAEAALAQARLDLERCTIAAPFAGRVLERQVDLGQVVQPNTVLGEIYATDYVEVRLPVANRELEYMHLPERYRSGEAAEQTPLPAVTIHSTLGGEAQWQGRIVRTEGAIDTDSRQLYVVARIDDPYGLQAVGKPPLKIGQYVTAEIEGRLQRDVILIPEQAMYQGSYVYVVEDGVAKRREVVIGWLGDGQALVRRGLQDGDVLVLSILGQVVSGTSVRIAGERASGVEPPRAEREEQRLGPSG